MEGLHQSVHSTRSACCLCGSSSTITTNGLFQASSIRCHERDPNQSYPPGAFGWTFLTPKDHPKRDSLEMPGAARQSSATMKTAAPLFGASVWALSQCVACVNLCPVSPTSYVIMRSCQKTRILSGVQNHVWRMFRASVIQRLSTRRFQDSLESRGEVSVFFPCNSFPHFSKAVACRTMFWVRTCARAGS